MANYRRVLGTVLEPDGTPYPTGASVRIKLNASNYSTDILFPVGKVSLTLSSTTGEIRGLTGDAGETAGILLWCEDEGLVVSNYTCTLPDNSYFNFNLAFGDGTPINLTTLRAAGTGTVVALDPVYVAIAAAIAQIASEFSVDNLPSEVTTLDFENEDADHVLKVLATFLIRLGAAQI